MTQSLAPERSAGDLEAFVLDVFRQALGDDSLEPSDDFFDAGGHSVLAVRVAARLSDAVGVRVPVALIFMHSTPAQLARAIPGLTSARPVTASSK